MSNDYEKQARDPVPLVIEAAERRESIWLSADQVQQLYRHPLFVAVRAERARPAEAGDGEVGFVVAHEGTHRTVIACDSPIPIGTRLYACPPREASPVGRDEDWMSRYAFNGAPTPDAAPSVREDVLDQFSVEPNHDAKTLARYVVQHPEFAEDLIELATIVNSIEETDRPMTDHDNARIAEAYQTVFGCNVPPKGWTCSRVRGHPGPCAASPAVPSPQTKGVVIQWTTLPKEST